VAERSKRLRPPSEGQLPQRYAHGRPSPPAQKRTLQGAILKTPTADNLPCVSVAESVAVATRADDRGAYRPAEEKRLRQDSRRPVMAGRSPQGSPSSDHRTGGGPHMRDDLQRRLKVQGHAQAPEHPSYACAAAWAGNAGRHQCAAPSRSTAKPQLRTPAVGGCSQTSKGTHPRPGSIVCGWS